MQKTTWLETGELNPEEIVTHHLPLEDAVQGYKIFEKRQEDCRKIILIPDLKSPSMPPSSRDEQEILNAE